MAASSEKDVELEGAHARRRWMSVLAKAGAGKVSAALSALPERPAAQVIRAPEIGLVMARGRAGGAGAAFNVGEITVTRAAVRIADGETGVAYIAGRDKPGAEAAAVVDAMMQSPRWRELAQRAIIAPLAAEAAAARDLASRKAAATKVEFFTMVRTRQPG